MRLRGSAKAGREYTAGRQLIDLDRLIIDFSLAQCGQDLDQVVAIAHENRDTAARLRAFASRATAGASCSPSSATRACHSGAVPSAREKPARDGTPTSVSLPSHHRLKLLVNPVQDLRRGAKVRLQSKPVKPDRLQALSFQVFRNSETSAPRNR